MCTVFADWQLVDGVVRCASMPKKRSNMYSDATSDPVDATRKQTQKYLAVLIKLRKVADVNLPPYKHQSLSDDLRDPLLASGHRWAEVALQTNLLPELMNTAAHVMRLVVLKAGPAFLLQNSTACSVVSCLCHDLWHLLQHTELSPICRDRAQETPLQTQLQQTVVSGLLPALAKYSQEVISAAVQQLAAVTENYYQRHRAAQANSQQQQQQQQWILTRRSKLLVQHCLITDHVYPVIGLWERLLAQSVIAIQRGTSLACTLPAAVHLAATAVPLLSKGLSLADMSMLTTGAYLEHMRHNADQLLSVLSSSATASLACSKAIITVTVKEITQYANYQHATQEQRQQQEEAWARLMLIDKLPEVLLLSLSYHAAGLSMLEPNNMSVAASKQQCSQAGTSSRLGSKSACQGFRSSHKVMLSALEIPVSVQHVDDKLYDRASCEAELHLMHALLTQYTFAESNDSPDHQDVSQSTPLFPAHLITPAAKMMLQMATMLPVNDGVSMHVKCLENLLWLLRLSKITPSVALVHDQGQAAAACDKARPLGCCTSAASTGCSPTTAAKPAGKQAATDPLKSVPAAIAAAVLHPALQLVSRSVVQLLHDTAPKKQQNTASDMRLVDSDEIADMAQQRSRLLAHFGELVLIICDSVEAKHIATVLKSDPVIPLVALEAVIRDQHFILLNTIEHQQEQQQQQQPPDYTTHYSQVVTRVLEAVHLLVQDQQFCTQVAAHKPSQQCSQQHNTLLLRVLSLCLTVYKVQQAAAVRWHEQQTALMDDLDSSATTISAAAAAAQISVILQTPNWYMTATSTVIGIAEAMSKLILQSKSSAQWCTQHQSVDDSNMTSSGASEGSRVHDSQGPSLLAVLLLRMTTAVVYHLEFFYSVLTQLAVAVGRAGGEFLEEVTAVFETAVSALLYTTPTSLLAVVNMVSQACEVLQQMPGWQPGEVDGLSVCDAATVAADVCEHDDGIQRGLDPAVDQQGQQQRQWEWRQQQLNKLQSMGCEGRAILADSGVSRTGHQEATAVTCSKVGVIVAALCSGEHDSSRSSSDSSTSAAEVNGHVATQPASNALNAIKRYCSKLRNLTLLLVNQFPTPYCCNEPYCIRLATLSEYQLVSGKACVCGGCKVARYCSRECQKKHWRQHKSVCQHLQQFSGR